MYFGVYECIALYNYCTFSCVRLSLYLSLSLSLCVYVCSSFVTVVNDISLLLCHAFMSFGHPFSNAYRKLLEVVIFASESARVRIPRRAVFVQVFEDIEMTGFGSTCTRGRS